MDGPRRALKALGNVIDGDVIQQEQDGLALSIWQANNRRMQPMQALYVFKLIRNAVPCFDLMLA